MLLRGEEGGGSPASAPAASAASNGAAASEGASEGQHRAAFDALAKGKATISVDDVAALVAGESSLVRVVLENGFEKDAAGGITFESFERVLRMFGGGVAGGGGGGKKAPLAARLDFVFDVVAKSGEEDDRLQLGEVEAFLRKARVAEGDGIQEGLLDAVEASFEAATAATGNDYVEYAS